MNARRVAFALGLAALAAGDAVHLQAGVTVTGELKKWHDVVLTFSGPETGETNQSNPFLDDRLVVTFRHQKHVYRVPGYFAADGDAANSGATTGDQWRVNFVPDATGLWSYAASFRTGPNVAISLDPRAGRPAAFDGLTGHFRVGPSDARLPDFRAQGLLQYVGRRYLRFAQTGEYFLKGGADSPENFLAYAGFDQTPTTAPPGARRTGEAARVPAHHYRPHVRDWRPGDPTWRGGKGKGIIGALNYLASKGMNSVYFLTMNVNGDGDDVWPWTSKKERYRFDCSKLDQWEIVFSHMDHLGIQLHVVLQETEDDHLLDGGALGVQRKLYFRELIARFAHHLAIEWNLGEENRNTDAQRRAFANYINHLDPYHHPIVVHTLPGQYERVYRPLLGFAPFDGPSLQMAAMDHTHQETLKWVAESAAHGHPWIVCLDEIGPASTGVKPDTVDFDHDQVRHEALWANLMAGGAGCEWYFGYQYPNNDLSCEDWRSRDHMWDLTRYALDFFHRYLPFADMAPHDELVEGSNDYCLARPGRIYAVYLPHATRALIRLASGKYRIDWYNPRTGQGLYRGTVSAVSGPGSVSLGQPPTQINHDWVALIRRQP